MVPTKNRSNLWIELLGKVREAQCAFVLKGHCAETNDVRLELCQHLEKLRLGFLAPYDHVEHTDVVSVNLSGNGREADTWGFPLSMGGPCRHSGALNEKSFHRNFRGLELIGLTTLGWGESVSLARRVGELSEYTGLGAWMELPLHAAAGGVCRMNVVF